MNDVADDSADVLRYGRHVHMEVEGSAAAVLNRFDIELHRTTGHEVPDLGFKFGQMLAGALNLCIRGRKSSLHVRFSCSPADAPTRSNQLTDSWSIFCKNVSIVGVMAGSDTGAGRVRTCLARDQK